MVTASCAVAALVLSVGPLGVHAGPVDEAVRERGPRPVEAVKVEGEHGQSEGFFDDFESYEVGSDIVGQGGWEEWHLGGDHADVSDETASSGSKSLKHRPTGDVVQRFTFDEGRHYVSVMTYIPSEGGGVGAVVLLNQYGDPNTDNWSAQVMLDPQIGTVESQNDFHATELITDQWVEVRFDIDLDADLMDISYNGEVFAPGLVWSENVSGGGITSLACVDLYDNGVGPVYYDDVAVDHPGGKCPPDMDEDGQLDLFDCCTFVNVFNAGGKEADFDQDGELDLYDYLSFVGEFDEGC